MTKDVVTCPIENTLKLIKRKWTIVLIRDMFLGKKHFYEFKEKNSELSNTVLSDTLKSMEQDGLIEKTFFNQSTEYQLTSKGKRLNKVLFELASFGLDELECGDGGDLEVIDMFKNYYANLLNVGE